MRYLILVIMTSISFSKNFAEKFDIASSHYKDGEYSKSIQLYEEIIKEGFHSEYLYYNLGNAYYRNGMIGQSIWAYNRAIFLNPRLENLKYNLEIVSSKIKDRVVLPEEFILVQVYIKLKSFIAYHEWLMVGSLLMLLIVCFFIFFKLFIFNYSVIKKIKFIFILITILVHLIIIDVFLENNEKQFGIIVFDNVNAYSGPFYGDNTILYKVNEGTKAQISQEQENWFEIVILNGDKAWIPKEKIRIL